VAELDPVRNPPCEVVPLRATIDVQADGKTETYAVSADTKSKSKRDMLIEGLSILRKRAEHAEQAVAMQEEVEVNGRIITPPKLGSGTVGHIWVDPLIKQWLGGQRDGTIVYWDLDDGFRYKYDIFQHKLTRVARDVEGT
jgi:hypothetical protein